MTEIAGRPVLVLGLGESGLAMARFLAGRGAVVRVADTRESPPMLGALRASVPQTEFHAGAFAESLLDGCALLALSPGLSPTRSAAAPLVQAAAAAKIPVVGEIELFAWALASLKADRGYVPKVIGVTGTNGKTTTTCLTALLVQATGRGAVVAGNVSPAALDALMAHTAAGALPDVWVLELSSFQLETTRSLECDAATVLNVTQDHLDWHGTLEAYVKAKARIFGRNTVQVLNRDDPLVAALARKNARAVTFGAGAPAQPDEYGMVRDGGLSWLAWAEDVSLGPRRRKAAAELPGIEAQVFVHRLMPVDALRIRGRHNALNALAALALARAIGCPLAPMLHALREYAGEPHRVQPVATIGGVEYFDDSKGTNVGATVAALEGLGAQFGDAGRRLVVILGGEGKGQDFSPLAAPLRAFARAVVLIGRDAGLIARALDGAPYPIEPAGTLPDAVRRCAALARSGDAVLLSPACASLDMFRDYKQRAAVFVEAVRAVGAELGQPC